MFVSTATHYGKHLDLGVTFDARNNQPGLNIFPRDVQKDVKEIRRMTFEYKLIKDSKEARDFLDVSGELSLKIKSGIVGVEGKGSYLKETKSDEGTVELLAKMTCETVVESIRHEDHSPSMKYNTDEQAKELGTHFAQSVLYGAEMVISIKIKNASDLDRKDIQGKFNGELKVEVASAGLEAELNKLKKRISDSSRTEISYFANDMPKSLPITLDDLITTITSFPSRIPNDKKGVPLMYAMHPLSELMINKAPTYWKNTALLATVDSLETEFDDLREAQMVMDNFFDSKASRIEPPIPNLIKFSKQLTKLIRAYKKVISKLNLDVKGPGEEQFEAVREEYDNALEEAISSRWKFKRQAETLIAEQMNQVKPPPPVFQEDMYSVIDKNKWTELLEDNRTMDQIKLYDEKQKRKIDERVQRFVLPKNVSENKPSRGNKELRIVLVGKTGHGKSSTGNTILNKDKFRVLRSPSSVTQNAQECQAKIDGMTVRIMDTPGLFDTVRNQKDVLREVAKVLDVFRDGIHIFAFVMNGTIRYTKEEQEVLKELKAVQKMRKKMEEKEELERKQKVTKQIKDYNNAVHRCRQLANTEAKKYFRSMTWSDIKEDLGNQNAIDAVTTHVELYLMDEEKCILGMKTDGDLTALAQTIEEEVAKEAQVATSSVHKELLEKMFRFSKEAITLNLMSLSSQSEDKLVAEVQGKLTADEIKIIGKDNILQSVQREKNSVDTSKRVQDKIKELTEELHQIFGRIADKWKQETPNIKKEDISRDTEFMNNVRKEVKAELTDEMKSQFSDSVLMDEMVQYLNNRSELMNMIESNSCFPAHAKVHTRNRGEVIMSDLKVGDLVPVMKACGAASYEEVYLFSHGDPNAVSEFVVIITETGQTLTLSPGHLLPIGVSKELREAGQVKIEDLVYIQDRNSFLRAKVTNLYLEHKVGLFCPHTASGTIVVDGVLASCYTNAIHPSLASLMLLSARFLYAVLPRSWYDHLAAYNPQSGMPKVVHKYRHYFI